MDLKNFKYIWVLGVFATALIVLVPVTLFLADSSNTTTTADTPWAAVKTDRPHTDHKALLKGPFETGSDVTKACLDCHNDAGHEVIKTAHWTWQSPPVQMEGRTEPVSVGKANLLNNFCIGVQSNWEGCTKCHAGYGWGDANFDFTKVENVDCLVCHEQTGTYMKTTAGQADPAVDLLAVARSVAAPTRVNCGSCHFDGGGGNGVKHGDLDESLYFPTETVDVHMGRLDFQCTDCHRTTDHVVMGRSISVSVDNANQIACTDCHNPKLHQDARINDHTDTVACQTCHIPAGALRDPTKMEWDWSTAGQDLPEDPHKYLKIKGSFVYERNFTPSYAWYNGLANRYLLGDSIDPTQTTIMNLPRGSINDPNAKIWPFKIHDAKQPYDKVFNYLLQPKTVGADGYWKVFDWDKAFKLGMAATGLPYSGQYGFASTQMYWPQTHMVAPAENALQCTDCHSANGRMNWQALGYNGDPMIWGGRRLVTVPTPVPGQ